MIRYSGKAACEGIAIGPVLVRKSCAACGEQSAQGGRTAPDAGAETECASGKPDAAAPAGAENDCTSGKSDAATPAGTDADCMPGKPDAAVDAEAEAERVRRAVVRAGEQLQALRGEAQKKLGGDAAAIFEAHQIMLEDAAYLGEIYSAIRDEGLSAERAAARAGGKLAGMFAGMDDVYMSQRASDVREITARLVRCLRGERALPEQQDTSEPADRPEQQDILEPAGRSGQQDASEPADKPVRQSVSGSEEYSGRPSILLAEDLGADEVLGLDRKTVAAVVTVRGSVHSHASILARMKNIPMLVDVPVDPGEIRTGMEAIADAVREEVIFEPTEEQRREAADRLRSTQESSAELRELRGQESVTSDGRRIQICANVSGPEDLQRALENGAEGIGLFRSEFLCPGRNEPPTEEEQFRIYRQAAEAMEGRPVVIRTFDLGADKQAAWFHAESLNRSHEANPALGYRGIRICLDYPEIFRPQLRALLRAAVYGNLAVMYPMITSVGEVRSIAGIVEEVREELEKSGIPCRMPRQGLMIETPAAAVISDELAELADFFSIGTNDLTQYVLAADRQNERAAQYYQPRHEAVLRLIRMTADNAHRHGKRVGICGELGADTALTEAFLDLGIDELSVAPEKILRVRKAVQEL